MLAIPSRRLLCLALACLIGVAQGREAPTKVVSINLCTDQLLLMLAAPGQIASVSYLARDPDSSFMARAAGVYPLNHARAEELIALRPGLVLAGAYSDPRLLQLLRSLGMQVEQFPLTHSISGIETDIRRLAGLLGRERRGAALITRMRARLARIATPTPTPPRQRPKALFYQPRGYTSGRHTLQDEALGLAGWRNLAADLGIEGYAPIDLERLLLARPQQIFSSEPVSGAYSRARQLLDHPALRALLGDRPMVQIPYKYWICAGPMIADAVSLLAAAHDH